MSFERDMSELDSTSVLQLLVGKYESSRIMLQMAIRDGVWFTKHDPTADALVGTFTDEAAYNFSATSEKMLEYEDGYGLPAVISLMARDMSALRDLFVELVPDCPVEGFAVDSPEKLQELLQKLLQTSNDKIMSIEIFYKQTLEFNLSQFATVLREKGLVQ